MTIKSLILTSQRGASGKGASCCKGMTGLFENRKEAPVVGTWEARVRWGQRSALIIKGFKSQGPSQRAKRTGGQ